MENMVVFVILGFVFLVVGLMVRDYSKLIRGSVDFPDDHFFVRKLVGIPDLGGSERALDVSGGAEVVGASACDGASVAADVACDGLWESLEGFLEIFDA